MELLLTIWTVFSQFHAYWQEVNGPAILGSTIEWDESLEGALDDTEVW